MNINQLALSLSLSLSLLRNTLDRIVTLSRRVKVVLGGGFDKRRENGKRESSSIGNGTIWIDIALDETGRDRKVVNALVTNVERDNRIGYGPLKRLRHLTNPLQTAICRLVTFHPNFLANQTPVMAHG